MESRYYDPETGRFINADKYHDTGTGLLGANMFAYCANNPVEHTDPEGDAYIITEHKAWFQSPTYSLSGIFRYPAYNPKVWNDASKVGLANCYMYALNMYWSNIQTQYWLNPGVLSGNDYKKYNNGKGEVGRRLINATSRDLDKMGINYFNTSSKKIKSVKKSKYYLIALVLTDKNHNAAKWDYHFYRTDNDLTWSHKPSAFHQVTQKDASGKRISHPSSCNRNDGNHNYKVFFGEYCLYIK